MGSFRSMNSYSVHIWAMPVLHLYLFIEQKWPLCVSRNNELARITHISYTIHQYSYVFRCISARKKVLKIHSTVIMITINKFIYFIVYYIGKMNTLNTEATNKIIQMHEYIYTNLTNKHRKA